MKDNAKPANLQSTFAVVKPDQGVDCLQVTETVYADLDRAYDNFAGHQLVAIHQFDRDWPTWEVHPYGDEIVVLLSGSANLELRQDNGNVTVRLEAPGDYIVVPKGTWHTASVQQPTRMLFITPGQGTLNREEPE